jgi:hypothetical protein
VDQLHIFHPHGGGLAFWGPPRTIEEYGTYSVLCMVAETQHADRVPCINNQRLQDVACAVSTADLKPTETCQQSDTHGNKKAKGRLAECRFIHALIPRHRYSSMLYKFARIGPNVWIHVKNTPNSHFSDTTKYL